MASSVLESIVAHSDIMSAWDSIAKNSENRGTFKERIQNAKQVACVAIFRNGSSKLGQTILEVQRERKDAARVKWEGAYKNNIKYYRDKKQQINKLLTLLTSKEVYKWSVADLKKMVNWKKVKYDGLMPARKKDLIVLWDLEQRRPEPTSPKQSEEDMDMDLGVNSEVDYN